MHVALTKPMKRLFYISILMMTMAHFSMAQTVVLHSAVVNGIATDYTVTAINDTSYARETILVLTDTANFQSIEVQLSEKVSGSWNTLQNLTLNKSDFASSPCSNALCFYRRDDTQWVLYLGSYSLYSRHKISLHFNTTFSNVTNDD